MRSGTIAFACGVLALCQLSALPDPFVLELLPLTLAIAALQPRWRWAALAASGFLWGVLRAGLILNGDLPAQLEGKDVLIEGTISSLPVSDPVRTRFLFTPQRVLRPQGAWRTPGLVRVSWYDDAPALRPGERWVLTVRLKRPHGFMNPGGFDYERWLFQARIRATGYVRTRATHRRLGHASGYLVGRVRHRLAEHIESALAAHPQAGLVKALAIGARDGISERQWSIFRATGTGHLMAISGLHIGLISGIAFWLGRLAWSLGGRSVLLMAAPRVGALAGLLAALAYAALAGFSVPTQRALVMVTVVMVALLLQRRVRPTVSLAWALLVVLVLDPFAVLAPGFWLSFGAVGAILFGMSGGMRMRGLWWRWGRVQWVVALGLLPLTLLFFGEHAVLAPVANLVAVPWVGLVVVPVILAGAAVSLAAPGPGGTLLAWGAEGIGFLWPLLEWLSNLDIVLRAPAAPPWWTLVAAGVGAFWLLLPRGTPARWLGGVWLLPLVFSTPPRLAVGEMQVTLLDVGQGLAAVIRTREHVLVYDTGPRYSAWFDAGEAVLVPFLRHRGIHAVDRVVLSHEDTDHVGGARTLLREVSVREIVANRLPPDIAGATPTVPCRMGLRWQWDGVDFRVLHPPAGYARGDNDDSCVLRASAPGGSVLLPGDVERAAEAALVRNLGSGLASDALVIPHHGSGTSSGEAFLRAVRPRYGLLAVGYRNRFRFPDPAVAARYREHGVAIYPTARHGALTLVVAPDGMRAPRPYRPRVRRFWHHDPSR
ncbi:MAG: DNA internalization-related competence protein ComEC/Rec2 [Gammaproteobacteria bacterium]|nr:DNA internalization-related competence protein ComEC/Rec2 [Gammaproteobacteria bacterium]NIR85475.1 DNA internalization-related competence protein ComEC/Rec2 [Gammaproteobacteria bacterium]NIR89527.1 DNA internalization-related competence protein ComEC/Rec2 [Gammaproteobacteria bacterium]NIU06612.1 DNA internalization-related competence protein ComEC/Rec2 [Gammaproteobacteria bacterium]NIV53495.1 DNA internalization-related competence protein ComEC/Rec2 [Gammaproteobacteria bacterium]